MQISDFIEEICQVGGLRLRWWRFYNTLIDKAFLAKRRCVVNDMVGKTSTKLFAVIRRHSQPTSTNRWGLGWGQTTASVGGMEE